MNITRLSEIIYSLGVFTIRVGRKLSGFVKFRILKLCCKLLRPKITLCYDPYLKTDGVGAQLQRIFAIRSLTHNLGLNYLHSPVDSVAIHPFDPYQSTEEMKVFLEQLNHTFHMENMNFDDNIDREVVHQKVLTFRVFFALIFKSLFRGHPLLIKNVEPFPVAEFDPNIYKALGTFLPNFTARAYSTGIIALHYRQGVGGKSVQFGEKLSRQLDVEYFVNVVESILVDTDRGNFTIRIYTDAPKLNQQYFPPTSQSHLWDQSPRFKNGQMSIVGLDVGESFEELHLATDVVLGGNPISAIEEMAGADVLVIGRSSLSYIAAILNKSGEIYFPSSFWHRPLDGWNVISDKGF